MNLSRRKFVKSVGAIASFGCIENLSASITCAAELDESNGINMRLGLVTYLWGRDWDLPTLIANCEKAKLLGVELRTEHAHGVEPSIDNNQRQEVRNRFADSPVVNVGLGTNEHFDQVDPAEAKRCVEKAKEYIKLSHDTGGSGVKVKPNDLHAGIPPEKTIEQIGRSLHELGEFGAGYGQEIRLEVHGSCSKLPTIRAIMEAAGHDNVGVCWNSNDTDLAGEGLEHNFQLVEDYFGDTCHVRELNVGDYPYQYLVSLLVGNGYSGWVLLECRTEPADRVAAMIEQQRVFRELVANAQPNLKS